MPEKKKKTCSAGSHQKNQLQFASFDKQIIKRPVTEPDPMPHHECAEQDTTLVSWLTVETAKIQNDHCYDTN